MFPIVQLGTSQTIGATTISPGKKYISDMKLGLYKVYRQI